MKNTKNIFKNRVFLTVFLSIVIFLITILLPKFFIILDKKISYYFLNRHNENFSVSKDIIMVDIDDISIEKIWKFPFSRDVYTNVIRILNEQNTWVIAFDIILSDNWPSEKIDDELAFEISKWNNVVFGAHIVDKWTDSIIPPLNKFLTWGLTYWYYDPEVNLVSWEVYSFSPRKTLNLSTKIKGSELIRNKDYSFNHFTLEILKKYLKRNEIKFDGDYFSLFPWEIIPYSKLFWDEVLINFLPIKKFLRYDSTNEDKIINRISLSDIYFEEGPFDHINFENKIVVIWATAKWLKDVFKTPNWEDFWVYVHWNIVNTILSWNFLVYFDEILEWVLVILLIMSSVYFNMSNNRKVLLISNLSLFIVFLFLVKYLLWLKVWILLNYPAHIIFAFILSVTFSNIAKYLTENKDKRKMLNALWEYISKDVASQILNNSWWIKLEWERKRLSIFFSDIEWFTTISEKMNPEELVVFLREYLWAMSNVIMDERGLIDKYEWDAIMALWWVFGHESSSSYDNCVSALKQRNLLKTLNVSWKKKFGEELKIRMGLNTWEAIVWNIWATWRKMEFTALWDSVNLASRLEEINKKYWTYICASETVYNEQKENFEFRYLDKIRVKWKTIPTSIYELLSKSWELSDLKKDIVTKFDWAISLYLKREFKKALTIFEELSKLWDKPSDTYIKRCNMYLKTPPEDNWDWVWTMKTK